MRTLTLAGLITLITLTTPLALTAQAPPAPPMTPCEKVTGIRLICGQQGPEDLVVVPGGQWVVAGAYGGSGGINLIQVKDRKSVRAYPSASAKNVLDAKFYTTCPGPPDASAFTTHGLWLEAGSKGVHRLYAVGHGKREAVEVFLLDATGGTPVLTWIGCALPPNPVGLNSVRGLSDGGFIATNFLARNLSPQQATAMRAGEKNGELWEWNRTSGWKKVPGSEAAGANGLEISQDGKWYYVAAWGSQSFFRLSRGGTGTPTRDEIPLGFRVDNLRWARDGSLLATGQTDTSSEIVKIDPATLKVTKVLSRMDDARFRAGTVAVEIGNDLWVGSYMGDRLAILTPTP